MLNIFKITSKPNETIHDVRKQLLFWILMLVNIVGIPIVIIGLIEALMLNQLITAFSYIFFFSPVMLTAIFRKKISFKISAGVILLSIWLIGVFNLIIYSFSGAAIPLFFTFLVLTTVFFDIKSAFIGLLLCLLPMLIVGLLFLNNTLSLNTSIYELSIQPIAWVTSSSVLLFLGSLIIISYGIIQKKMLHSLQFIKEQSDIVKNLNLQLKEDIIKRKKIEEELKTNQDNLEKIVKERTRELEDKNKDLEEYNDLFIGREFRIKELKDKVKELEAKL